LIGHDLHESDARGIVDADMNELPADAVVTVNRARISAGDAMSYRADPADRRIRLTVASDTPVSMAIGLPV
jgi:hypothetical protein